MSTIDEKETGHVVFDDRDYFEDEIAPTGWLTLPAGFDVIVPPVSYANAVAIKAEDVASSYFGFVPRQQLDSDETKGTIAALQERGIDVTIVDGKTETAIDAVAYQTAVKQLDDGNRYPYDDPVFGCPSNDWAKSAARGVLYDLQLRRAVAHPLDIDEADREEIVDVLSDIVRAAFIRRSA
ncbi:hypothetical protein [Rhizobium leguminosarum]|uniref:hypothetical protein n=1 Tax=Rhizobium leguminosarum TaxID=384 RepID=UPI001C951BE7|nr:hypothetical protein [Rhizobium leguminosarum]MBY5329569.1 hypothetical protein [Rhizobium leguminosarum]